MAQIEGEIVINRTAEEVFDFVSDQCNEPLYNPEMLSVEKVGEGPAGEGTRYSILMRQGKRELPMTLEFTEFDRPSRLGSRATMAGMTTEGRLTFEPLGTSTVMRWAWDVHTSGVFRLLGPVVTAIGKRQEARIWGSLKRLLEAEGATPR